MTTINPISIWNIPSLACFEDNRWDAFGTPAYNVANYVAGKGPSDQFTTLTKLQLLRALLVHGKEPFYASDVFGPSESLGGWMNGLRMWDIVRDTGNRRDVLVPIGGDLYRKSYIIEWELAIDPTELAMLYGEIFALITENLGIGA